MILFKSYLSKAPDPCRHQTDPAHRPIVSLLGRKIPCSGKRNSLLSEEQGTGCKVLNPLGDRLSKLRKEAEIVRNFQTFPANFPATGNSRSAHSTAEVGEGDAASRLRFCVVTWWGNR